MKKLLALLLALAMLLTLVACSGGTSESSSVAEESSSESKSESKTEESSEESSEVATGGRFDALQETEDHVDLLLYWHNLQPTVNEEPTEESPKVRNACRQITADWLTNHPNVTIEWCQNLEMTDEWVTVNYTAHTGPDDLFYWGGSQWVQKGMALVLDDIMASPNYYEPGSPAWKDMYPEYLFDGTEGSKMAINDAGNIIAVPVIMNPGSATAYYYNEDLAETLGLENPAPTDWATLKQNITTALDAGYTGTVLYNHGQGWNSGGSWDAQFSLNAAYFAPMIADNDYNGDGVADFAEVFRSQWEKGNWYISNNPALQEYWEEYLWKIKSGMEDGALDIDYTQPWADGKVLYVEEGLWSIVTYASNTELTFSVGMFPPPYQTPEASQYVQAIEYTEAGPYKPTISVAFNIMNPETQDKPAYVEDYVVDWMKCATTNDNLSIQIEEGEGVVGATKGCKIPSMLTDWFKHSFPIAPTGYSDIIPGFTDQTSTEWNALMEEYGFGMIDQATWFQKYDALLYKTMTSYFENEDNVKYQADWAAKYGEGWETNFWTDTTPVEPA